MPWGERHVAVCTRVLTQVACALQVGAVAVLTGFLTLTYGPSWPLVFRLVGGDVAALGCSRAGTQPWLLSGAAAAGQGKRRPRTTRMCCCRRANLRLPPPRRRWATPRRWRWWWRRQRPLACLPRACVACFSRTSRRGSSPGPASCSCCPTTRACASPASSIARRRARTCLTRRAARVRCALARSGPGGAWRGLSLKLQVATLPLSRSSRTRGRGSSYSSNHTAHRRPALPCPALPCLPSAPASLPPDRRQAVPGRLAPGRLHAAQPQHLNPGRHQ